MSQAMAAVRTPLAPTKIAPGTYLIRDVQHALGQPLSVYINSMVIQGAEPVIVDTGSAKNRRAWLEQVFGLVDPKDVRWVFLSHEDTDHSGNLGEVMAACPNATLVCNWALVERFSNAYDFPLRRCRWLDDGQALHVGDRNLVALRPPVYDQPTTRGLLDTSTGVFWAADTFATPVPGGVGRVPLDDLSELNPVDWWNGMMMFGLHALSPWLSMVDADRYAHSVSALSTIGITTLASGHSPAITGSQVDLAWDMIGRLAGAEPPPCPDQAILELILGAMEDGGAAG